MMDTPIDKQSTTAPLWHGLLRLLLMVIGGSMIIALLAGGMYLVHLDQMIRSRFDGNRWSLPARVYASPLELFPDMTMRPEEIAEELRLLFYRSVDRIEQLDKPGTFVRNNNTFYVYLREFAFWDGLDQARRVQITLDKNKVTHLKDWDRQQDLPLLRFEPAEIAGIYPNNQEDRILLKREELPPVLVDALIAMEDRSFFEHFGIDLRGIGRAIMTNLQAGRTLQGGSSITQQLVKNYFLTNERTFVRKINEALMAILLESRYSKDEILEVYSNEVYLGQDGDRSIHGMELASRFFFGRRLSELDLHHIALMVGMIRGPSAYDPRRFPERAKERRDLVLDVMHELNLIGARDNAIAKSKPLDVLHHPPRGITTRYPAFIGLVRRQLRQHYREEDLTTAGLQIFTTLHRITQTEVEQALSQGVDRLERANRRVRPLQAATLVADTQTGEVLAVVGDRDVRLEGYNRAIMARRQPGSLLKPAVYLAALEHPDRYTLVTLLDDSRPISLGGTRGGRRWRPMNYDRRFHGHVTLQEALAKSYNLPVVRVGLDLKLDTVIAMLQRLGVKRPFAPYPSLILGGAEMTLFEIAQLYQTFASGGFYIPLRAIREVTDPNGRALQRYPLNIQQVVEPGPAYLIVNALQQVIANGTAREATKRLGADLKLAGKTGTTDHYRDSWFAGFSGNRLSVVWVGRDDNRTTGLSGATGALPIWIDIMQRLDLVPLDMTLPTNVEMAWVNPRSGRHVGPRCRGARETPFVVGSTPPLSGCGGTQVRAAPHTRASITKKTSSSPKAPPTEPLSNFFRELEQR